MRIAIISDIHEDVQSLERILKKIEKHGVDHLVCLGDISGFSVPYYTYTDTRNAHQSLSLLREKKAIIVPGNHDYHAVQRVPREQAVFEFPADWFELSDEKRAELARGELWLHDDELDINYTDEDKEFLRSLPEFQVLETGGKDILFTHYIYPNTAGYKKGFYATGSEFRSHFEFMEKWNCSIGFTGHTHIRGCYLVENGQFTQHRYGRSKLKSLPVCVGIPPVTTHDMLSGFCIFETENSVLRTIRC